MRYAKMIPFILILICIFSLIHVENEFLKKQHLLVLESNELLSDKHIILDSNSQLNLSKLESAKENFSVFGILKRSPKVVSIAFYTKDYKHINLPLKSGDFFSSSNSKEVIVGEGIETYIINNHEYYNYEGSAYKVIGRLGLSADSPLKRYVLINDQNLLKKAIEPLAFDGSNLNSIAWLKGHRTGNKGVERWFDVTFIMKWISATTWIISIFSAALAAYFFFIITKEINHVKHQIGLSLKAILIENLLIMTGMLFSVAFLLKRLFIRQSVFFDIGYWTLTMTLYLTLMIVFVFLSVVSIRKEVLHD